MRKRLRKKISKRKCLKCGGEGGIIAWHIDKKGRYRSGRLICFYCDMNMPRM